MSNPPFKFKVGNKYIRRDGVIVECIRLHGGGASFNSGSVYFSTWNSGSRYNDNRLDNFDIISEQKSEPTTNMFDLNKPFKIKNGQKVKILTLKDGPEGSPIVGLVDNYIRCWNEKGQLRPCEGISIIDCNFNLVNDPPVKKIVPLEPNDIGPRFIFKHQSVNRFFIGFWNHSYITLKGYKNEAQEITFSYLSLHHLGWEYSKDGGETWQLCQKEVTE